MSITEMASLTKFSYRRLKNEGCNGEEAEERSFRRIRSWSRLRKLAVKKRPMIRIRGLRRFLKRKVRLLLAVKVSWGQAVKRLKESQTYVNDLFSGNYLFLQISPSPLKYVEKSSKGHDFHSLSSRQPVGKIV